MDNEKALLFIREEIDSIGNFTMMLEKQKYSKKLMSLQLFIPRKI